MKKYVLVIFLMFVSLGLYAQNNNVKQLEFEIGGGFNLGGKIYNGSSKIGMQIFFEPRLNIANSPFDVGLQAALGYFDRNEDSFGRANTVRHRGMLVTFVDYNYRKWNNVALFGGLGVGFSAVNYESSWIDSSTGRRTKDTVFDRSFVVNPRVGIELWNHLRFTLEYKLMKKEYSYVALNVGFTFGGGYRK